MGTWYYEKCDDESMIQFIQRKEFSGATIVASSIKLTQAYVAYQLPNGHVGAAVVLINRERASGTIGLKVIEEEMLPYYFDCPDRILDLLSDTTNESAIQWRNGCRERNAKNREYKGDLTGKVVIHARTKYRILRRHPRYTRSWIVENIQNGVTYRMAPSILKNCEFYQEASCEA